MGQWVSSNHNHADEYMASCLPFCSGSISLANGVAQVIEFPYVTRFIQVFNNTADAGNGVRVGFTENGVEGNSTLNGTDNYFVVPADTASARLEVKCTKIFLAGDGGTATCSVVAGYTNIPENRFLNLTGSEGFEGVG
jgi:hypothetical protein